MLTEQIVQRISDNLSDAKGRECKYFRLNDYEGLKTWNNEWSRDKSYDMQAHCYDVGLAPRLGRKVEIETLGGEKLFGYVTEHLSVLLDEVKAFAPAGTDEYYEEHERANNAAYELEVEYRGHGIHFEDACLFNIGRMENGELCAIDFGDIYTSGDEPIYGSSDE